MEDIYSETNSQIISSLCSNLKNYRVSMRITQEELSRSSGIGIATIKKMESGRMRNISLQTLLSILRTLGLLDEIKGVLPPIAESAYSVSAKSERQIKRVRK